MPSMHIFRRLTTRPFGSDDLHLLCLVCGLFRVLQLVGTIILWVHLIVRKWRGTKPRYCEEFEGGDRLLVSANVTNSTEPVGDVRGGMDGRKWIFSYVAISFAYMMLDIALLVAIWKAASVGTPTQPHGREVFLRPVLRFKVLFMTIFLVAVVITGILVVHFNRHGDYDCNYKNAYDNFFDELDIEISDTFYQRRREDGTDFEDTGWYIMFCIILVTQALELLVWPGFIAKRVLRWIKRQEHVKKTRTGSHAACVERFLGGCLQCCGLFCCFKTGGHELGAGMKGQLKDAVEAMLDYINVEGTLSIVLSDLYVSFRMLARVQRERKHDCVGRMLKLAETANAERGLGNEVQVTVSAGLGEEVDISDVPGTIADPSPLEECAQSGPSDGSFYSAHEDDKSMNNDHWSNPQQSRGKFSRQGSVFALDLDGDELCYRARSRSIVSPSTKNDVVVMREAAHFIRHSNAIYDYLPEFVYKKTWQHLCGIPLPLRLKARNESSLDEGIDLQEIGFGCTTLIHLQPENGIAKTPYCILIDEAWKTVIVAIRGTASFEDIVIDLQLTPSNMDAAGRRCGFDGTNQFCHNGVLTRCRWLYEDLERHGILYELLLGEKPRCPNHRLVVTGHSLGAGCASVISLMLRRRFPALQCYAFCPPGGLLTERLAEECESFVISVVNDTDLIPRMSYENLEKLRDEAFEILARIKVSKLNMIQFLSKPCSDGKLTVQNAKVLFPKEDIPTNTEFYTCLETYLAMKNTRKERSAGIRVPLYPPGKIMYLVRSKNLVALGFKTMKNKYTPQWAEKTDFNEILMARTVGHDHSADVVEENLSSLLRTFEGNESDVDSVCSDDSDDGEAILKSRHEDYLLNAENDFVCCSTPQGYHALVPAMIGTIAIVLTSMSNNWCAFVSRSTVVRVDGQREEVCEEKIPDHYGLGVSTGLWSYLEKVYNGSGPRDDPDSYLDSDFCLPYPLNLEPDPFLLTARLFSTLCVVVGVFSLIILWFASCQSLQRRTWYKLSALLLLASLFQGLVFLIFQSDLCNELVLRFSQCTLIANATCSFAWGARVGISACVIWFLAAVCAAQCGRSVGRRSRFSLKGATKISRRFQKKAEGI